MSTIGIDKLAEGAGEILKVAPQAYDDGLKPAVRQGGKALETITGTLNSLLAPLKCLNAKIAHLEEQFIKDLDEKAQHIPEENRIEPELSVVGPALEDLKFSLSDEDIKSLYLNLLSSSMDSRVSTSVHRSFVEIIKQLSPIEARLLNFITTSNSKPLVMAIGKIRVNFEKGGITVLEHFISTPFENLTPEQMSVCFSNLHRLGIVNISYSSELTDPTHYIDFDNCYAFKKYHSAYINQSLVKTVVYQKGILSLTPLGESFCNICIQD